MCPEELLPCFRKRIAQSRFARFVGTIPAPTTLTGVANNE
jgi:hypothetical protein